MVVLGKQAHWISVSVSLWLYLLRRHTVQTEQRSAALARPLTLLNTSCNHLLQRWAPCTKSILLVYSIDDIFMSDPRHYHCLATVINLRQATEADKFNTVINLRSPWIFNGTHISNYILPSNIPIQPNAISNQTWLRKLWKTTKSTHFLIIRRW